MCTDKKQGLIQVKSFNNCIFTKNNFRKSHVESLAGAAVISQKETFLTNVLKAIGLLLFTPEY